MITGPRQTLKLARKLRSEMSLPERLLWQELRQRPGGYKFRRQHPAGLYALDFYCASVRLAVEIDGIAHDGAAAVQRDAARSHFLRSQGIAITRIPAQNVLVDIASVIIRLVEICDMRGSDVALRHGVPLHQPAAGPPPHNGED